MFFILNIGVTSGLFSENDVVSKVSEHTKWWAAYFTRIVKAVLQIHVHNPKVVQTLTGFGKCGAALLNCALVNPKWRDDTMIDQGSGGAYEASQRMTAMVGWAATASE